MSKISRIHKKRRQLFLKAAELFDDIYYDQMDMDDAIVKVKYTLESDVLLKDNQEDVKEILTHLKATVYKIYEVK